LEHRMKRKECYQLNLQAGVYKFYYRDLKIFECNKPYRPLNQHFH
jgi:hypothetical protein